MKTVRLYIIDDDPDWIRILSSYIEKTNHTLVGSSTDPLLGIREVNRLKVDIVLLDMQMQPLSGLEVIPQLPPHVKIIFCTSYREMAYEGYDRHLHHFILKPMEFAKFYKVLDKTVSTMGHSSFLGEEELGKYFQFIIGPKSGSWRVWYDKLSYVMSVGEKCVFNFRDGTSKQMAERVGTIFARFPQTHFARISTYTFVALAAIERATFSKVYVQIKGKQVALPMGRKYAPEIHKWIADNS